MEKKEANTQDLCEQVTAVNKWGSVSLGTLRGYDSVPSVGAGKLQSVPQLLSLLVEGHAWRCPLALLHVWPVP